MMCVSTKGQRVQEMEAGGGWGAQRFQGAVLANESCRRASGDASTCHRARLQIS